MAIDLTGVYQKLKKFEKIDKVRWYNKDSFTIDLDNLTQDNISSGSHSSFTHTIYFSSRNTSPGFSIGIKNTDVFNDTNNDESGADIVLNMENGSTIKIWQNFFNLHL